MAQNDDSNEDAVYKVDTVPPPDGDDDAYSAPTKVGALASAVVNELIVAKSRAERESAEVAAASQVKPRRIVRDENGNEVDQLDEDDIEAELAFPPPPRVPSTRPGPPSGSSPASSKAPSSAAPIKTQPIVPVTPVSSIQPSAPTASMAPASTASPAAPTQAAPATTIQGLPPAVMIGGAIAALLVVVAIIFALR